MNSKSNSTLKAVLDVILHENPATQDEIAEKLGLSRRYVTKLLQPMVKRGVVRRAYILDLKKFDEFSDMDAFNNLVMGTSKVRKDAIVQSSTEAVKQAVKQDPGAIGFVSMGDIVEGMVSKSIYAFLNKDINIVREIRRDDDKVDDLFDKALEDISKSML